MQKTFMEAPSNPPPIINKDNKVPSGKAEDIFVTGATHTIMQDQQGTIQAIPKMRKVETFEQKLYRKFSEEPLVPIGCAVTTYCLVSGIKSFQNADMVRSQKMMRFRVTAQLATILVFVGYAGINSFDLSLRPGLNEDEKKD